MSVHQHLGCQATHPADSSRSCDAQCVAGSVWCSMHCRWKGFFEGKLNHRKVWDLEGRLVPYPDDPKTAVHCFNVWSSVLAIRIILASLFYNHLEMDSGHTQAVRLVAARRDIHEWKLLQLGSLNHPDISTMFMYLELFTKWVSEENPQAFTEASLKAQLQATCVKYQVADYSIVGPPGSVPLAQCICTAGQQKPASATCPPALHGWVHPRSWPARAKIRRTLHEQTKEALRRRLMPAERPSSPAARGGNT